jgi:hypothetical protein
VGRTRRIGDLDLNYDPAHEEREWIVQRIGWGLMIATGGAALAGLLGPGPLSRREEGKVGEALYVEYQRFGRCQAPAELKIFCRPKGQKEFALSFDRPFIEGNEIIEISPEPLEASAKGDRYVYRFSGDEGQEQLVVFRLEAAKFGRARSKVTLDGTATVNLRFFYWP